MSYLVALIFQAYTSGGTRPARGGVVLLACLLGCLCACLLAWQVENFSNRFETQMVDYWPSGHEAPLHHTNLAAHPYDPSTPEVEVEGSEVQSYA